MAKKALQLRLGKVSEKEYLALAYTTFMSLGWKLHHISSKQIVALSAPTRRGLGEWVSVVVQGGHATIESQNTTVLSFRANKRNVQTVIKNIAELYQKTNPMLLKEQIKVYESVQSDFEAEHGVKEELRFRSSIFETLRFNNGAMATPVLAYLLCLLWAYLILFDIHWFSPHPVTLYSMGGMYADNVVFEGEYWRLLFSVLIHAGIIHLLFNIWMLLMVGAALEQLVKPGIFFLAFFLTGLFGSATAACFNSFEVSVGASGAILGLMAFYVTIRTMGLFKWEDDSLFLQNMVIYLVYLLIFSQFQDSIDHAGHIGGLVSGAILGLAYYPVFKQKNPSVLKRLVIGFLATCVLSMGGYALIRQGKGTSEYTEILYKIADNEGVFRSFRTRYYGIRNDDYIRRLVRATNALEENVTLCDEAIAMSSSGRAFRRKMRLKKALYKKRIEGLNEYISYLETNDRKHYLAYREKEKEAKVIRKKIREFL